MKTSTWFVSLGLVTALAGVGQATEARLQVIHNAADPAAATVDIYVNGGLFENDFEFREATEFRTVPAGVELRIGIAPGTSSSADDALAVIPVTLAAGKTYVAIANGVLDPNAFAANPSLQPIGFALYPCDRGRETSRLWYLTDLLAFHGATDAPSVDIRIRKWPYGPLFSGLSYGKFSGYRAVLPTRLTLDVTPAGQPEVVVASFEANLSGLRGGAAVVFASGFLEPGANQNGKAFGLFAALPSGAVVELPAVNATARLQVIHNAADPAAASVDIYVNGGLYESDFAFREATEFRTVPAGVELQVGVAPGNSTSAEDVIATIPVTLESGKTYVAVANGVLDPTLFAANPEGKPIGFTLIARSGLRENCGYRRAVSLVAFHGSTDAPAVDLYVERTWGENKLLAGGLSYGEFSDYAWLKPRHYTVSVTPAGQPQTVVASFEADLSGLAGRTAVVFASGFLDPTANQNGQAFGLYAALSDGTVVELPAASAVAARITDGAEAATALPESFELSQNFPNPFNPGTTIEFALPVEADVRLDVFNVLGQQVRELVNERLEAGRHSVQFDAGSLPSGVYFYRIAAGADVSTRSMTLVK